MTETRRFTHGEILKILSGLLMALLTAMLSTSVASTALPTIVGELGGQNQLAWVASAMLLTMTASTPLWGKLSDLFGRKFLFQFALVVFVLGSVAGGFAWNMPGLIAARAVQGLGAGGLFALTHVVLGDIVAPRERGRYAGYIGGTFGVATVAGPLVGGFIVDADRLGWRWCFFVCVPLAVVAFTVIQKVLKLPRVKRDARVDWLGACTVTGGATALMLVLTLAGEEFPWNSPWTYGLGGLSAALIALAVVAERRAAEPILPPRLFRDRTFVWTSVASAFVGVLLYSAMNFLPQYFQIGRGMSPTMSGLMTLPMVLGLFVTSVGSGRIVTGTGRWKIFPVVGMVLMGTGTALLSVHLEAGLVGIGADVAVLGFGLGLTMQILILAAQNSAKRADMAATTAGVTFFRSLGGAIGVAAFGAILTARLSEEMSARLRAAHLPVPSGRPNLGSPEAIHRLPEPIRHIVLESFTRAVETAFLVGVPVAALGLLAVLALKEQPLRSAPTTAHRTVRGGDAALVAAADEAGPR
ncbi:MAG: MDR family MFS transporter [Actinomadura sp.]